MPSRLQKDAAGTAVDSGYDAQSGARKASAGAGSQANPGGARDVRVGRLDTATAIREEIAKLYRSARKVAGPRPSPSDATKLAYLLNALATSVLGRDLEERLAALEESTKGTER